MSTKTKDKTVRDEQRIEPLPPPSTEIAQRPASLLPIAGPPQSLVSAGMNEAAAAFLEEVKGPRIEPPQIPIIAIQHREAQFRLPSGELVEQISGYPIYYFQTRRFYAKPPQPGQKGQPPDCWSADMVVPHPTSLAKQAETCLGCQHDAWQTGRDGRSKACGAHTWVFLLNPEFGTPPLAALTAPPSSIRTLLGTRFEAGYFGQCRAKHRVYEIVWTTFGLKQWGGQVQYCTLEPLMGPACTDLALVRQIAAVRNDWIKAMDTMRGLTPTVGGDGEE